MLFIFQSLHFYIYNISNYLFLLPVSLFSLEMFASLLIILLYFLWANCFNDVCLLQISSFWFCGFKLPSGCQIWSADMDWIRLPSQISFFFFFFLEIILASLIILIFYQAMKKILRSDWNNNAQGVLHFHLFLVNSRLFNA